LVVLLQGDDIFLDHLPGDARDEAIRLCRQLVPQIDRFVVHSRFYADKMQAMLDIPDDKIVITPLSIDIKPFQKIAIGSEEKSNSDFRLGYFARIAPEKGLHRLVDTFIRLASQSSHDDVTLHVAGWLGEGNRPYLQQQQQKIEDAALTHRFTYHGSPNLVEKIAFLRTLDLMCVPTDYEEPKGLFVLESLAAGVPVVQPNHGAFAELIEATGGGLVVQPDCVDALCDAIQKLKADRELRARLGSEGSSRVYANHSIESAARQMHQILFE
jgi:glycosyltransferase involved in cell wall biosynthesis